MSRFSPQFLDELRGRTLLSALIGSTTKLVRAGREWKACCPFHHEKSPSFYVNDDKGFYHCFGCSAHGDAIRWLTDARGLPFVDAVKELADAAGLALPAPDPHASEREARASKQHDVMAAAAEWFAEQLKADVGAEARAYLAKRGIVSSTVEAFGIGFAPDRRDALKLALARFGDGELVENGLLISVEEKTPYDRFRGRLMIPIRDPRGRVIAFGGRILGSGEPKYLNSPDTPLFDKGRTLYNLDRAAPAARKKGRLIVVEGYLDVIALAQAGIDEAVAPLGTALTEAQLERLWRVVDVPVLCFDGDEAGRKAAIRATERALSLISSGRSLSVALLPNGQDPDDLVRNEGVQQFENILSKAEALDNFLWKSALHSATLDTPEQRSSFGKGLRDLARLVQDEDLRVFYLAAFNERLADLFDRNSKGEHSRHNPRRFQKERRTPNDLMAIAEHGIIPIAIAPSAVAGLLRFPKLIGEHAEILGHFNVLLHRRDFRQLAEEMLSAALMNHPLEPARLHTILEQAGMSPNLERLLGKRLLPYSFLDKSVERPEARRDLSDLMDKLSALPEVQAALNEATERLGRGLSNDDVDFVEQQRLREVVSELLEDLKRVHVGADD